MSRKPQVVQDLLPHPFPSWERNDPTQITPALVAVPLPGIAALIHIHILGGWLAFLRSAGFSPRFRASGLAREPMQGKVQMLKQLPFVNR